MASTTSSSTTSTTESTEPGPAVRPGSDGSSPPGRDSRLDNAKFILIALVVIGHAIGPVSGDYAPAGALYYWIYMFHMPAFILISGYLSRSFDASANRVEKLVLTLAVPYLIFWTLHTAINSFFQGSLPELPSLLTPPWTLWFLVALFLWRLTVPVWHRLRWPVLVAVLISLTAATADLGSTLSLGRVVSFLPFFVLGLTLRPEHFAYLGKVQVRVASAVFLAATAVLAVPISDRLSRDWLFWRDSLTDRDIEPLLPSIGLRLGFMTLALLMTVAVLSLTPSRRTWFTRLGAYTLYIYLGHGILLLLIRQATPWNDAFTGAAGLAANLVLGAAMTLFLCLPLVRASMRWGVEPQLTWLLRREDRPPGTPAAPAAPASAAARPRNR